MPFPSIEHQFKPGTSGAAGRPRPPLGRRKARALRVAALKALAARGSEAEFDGSALQLLQSIYRNPQMDLGLRVACANAAVRFEASAPASEQPALDPDERRKRLSALLSATGLVAPAPPQPAQIEGQAVDLDAQERRAAMEQEKARLLAEIARLEGLARDREAARAGDAVRAELGRGGGSGTGTTPNAYQLHDAGWHKVEQQRAQASSDVGRYDPLRAAWNPKPR